MNIVMAVKHLFSEYWAATRREESGMDVNWDEVFAKIWIAGGVDYAITFNAIFGFDAIGATIRDSVRRGRDIAIKMASRPDDMERFGFVLGAGGGGQGITPLSNAIKTGDPVYSMIAGAESRTDGDKQAYKGAREGYGIGQRSALFDAWDQAKEKLTEATALGLYIVQLAVEKLNGQVWFESIENGGTTFYVSIPLKGIKKRGGVKLKE